MEQLSSQLSHYLWSLKKWEAHVETVVIPTPFTWFGCKYPQIKAESLQLKDIFVVVYRAKKMRIVSMSQYLWTWLYMITSSQDQRLSSILFLFSFIFVFISIYSVETEVTWSVVLSTERSGACPLQCWGLEICLNSHWISHVQGWAGFWRSICHREKSKALCLS